MTNSTTTTTTTTTDRPSGRPPRSRRRGFASPEERAEALAGALPLLGSGDPEARGPFAVLFRRRLREEVERIGSPVSSGVLALAYASAALATYEDAGLHPEHAEEVRLRVLADESESLGVSPLRGGLPAGVVPTLNPGVFAIPGAQARDGAKVRNGGGKR